MVIVVLVAVLTGLAVVAPVAEAQELRVFTLAGGGVPFAREGMRATSASLSLEDVAVRPDGSVVIGSYGVVWRIDGHGRLRRVLGRPTGNGPEGDGGRARDAILVGTANVAHAADGSLLVGLQTGCGVRRVSPDGVVTRVAGQRPPDNLAPCWISGSTATEVGDGGPARDALIGAATGVSATPDGGFLVADQPLNRVRKVSADGTIATVAGRGGSYFPGQPPSPYSGPATEAVLSGPTDVASLPDGGFRFADGFGIHQVAADGTIRTVQLAPAPRSRGLGLLGLSDAGLPFGTVVRGESSLHRLQLLGDPPWNLAFGSPRGFFDGDGDVLERTYFETLIDVEELPDGGLLLVSLDRVRAALPAGTERLGVAIGSESLPALARRRVAVRTTVPAELELEVYSGRKLVDRTKRRGGPGITRMRVPRTVTPELYTFRVIARTPDGASASSRLRAILGPRMPVSAAEVAAEGVYWAPFAADEYPYPVVLRCHRFGPRRVDCAVGEGGTSDGLGCMFVAATRLARRGIVYARPYNCLGRGARVFKRHPRWSRPWRMAAPL